MGKKHASRRLIACIVGSLFLPFGAHATEAELLKKLEAMQKEIEQLRAMVQSNQASQEATKQATTELKEKVQRAEDKSSEKWLTIGGDYEFRADSLHGETKTYTDVGATFANAGDQIQAAVFANPSAQNAAMLSGLMAFSEGMAGVKTYQQAQQFLATPANQQMIAGLNNYAVSVPSYKPKNSSLYTHRFGLDLNARATQDVSVSARLLMYKTWGASDDDAVTNGGSTPFFADRVGVFDGTLGHIPSSDYVNVDRAYATWSNIADQDIWFSVGRRPSTNGTPSHLRYNMSTPGRGGDSFAARRLRLRRHDDRLGTGYRRPAGRVRQTLLRSWLRKWLYGQSAGQNRSRTPTSSVSRSSRSIPTRCVSGRNGTAASIFLTPPREQHLLRRHHAEGQSGRHRLARRRRHGDDQERRYRRPELLRRPRHEQDASEQ
jgi:hypothetical protein